MRGQGDCFAVGCQGRIVFTTLPEQSGEVALQVCVGTRLTERGTHNLDCLIAGSMCLQLLRQLTLCSDAFGGNRDRLAQCADCVFAMTDHGTRAPECNIQCLVVWLECYCPLERCQGTVVIAVGSAHTPQGCVTVRIVGCKGNRFLEVVLRLGGVAPFEADAPQCSQQIWLIAESPQCTLQQGVGIIKVPERLEDRSFGTIQRRVILDIAQRLIKCRQRCRVVFLTHIDLAQFMRHGCTLAAIDSHQ